MTKQQNDGKFTKGNTAAELHGARSFKAHGEQALRPASRSRLMELREAVQDRPGVLALMQEKCADSVLLFELIQSYIASQVRAGHSVADIPSVRVLPAYMNSMQRALVQLLAAMPKDGAPASAELERIQRVIDEHDQNAE